jgi:hypothetical protein
VTGVRRERVGAGASDCLAVVRGVFRRPPELVPPRDRSCVVVRWAVAGESHVSGVLGDGGEGWLGDENDVNTSCCLGEPTGLCLCCLVVWVVVSVGVGAVGRVAKQDQAPRDRWELCVLVGRRRVPPTLLAYLAGFPKGFRLKFDSRRFLAVVSCIRICWCILRNLHWPCESPLAVPSTPGGR